MNLMLGVIPKKISNRIFLLLAAVILIGGFFVVSYALAAHTTVDSLAPTVQSITTKDSNSDGRVETAVIVFSEPVDDDTFSVANFTLGGQAVNTINTGGADDNTLDIVITAGVAGTKAKDVTYTQGTGADLAGNLLANIVTGTIVEVDDADPVFMSAKTTATNKIELTFSEDLNGSTVTNADFNVAGYVLTAPDASELNGVVILTTGSNFGTGDKPAVTYNITVSNGVKDLNNNQSPAVGPITPADKVAPIIAATRTVTTTSIEVTFSETMSAVNKADFAVAGNTIDSITFTAGQTTAMFVLQNAIGAGDTPQVSTVALPANTKDNAAAPNTITGGLTSTPVDDVAPTVSIVLADPALKVGETSLVIFTFSEPVTDFTAADVITGSGSIGAVSATGNPLAFTATLTPTVDTEDAINIITVGTGWTDAAGNAPIASTDSANYTVETKKPTVSLASATANPTNGLIAVTAEFSENITGFDATDITVGNGAVENFVTVDGDSYAFNVNPTDGANVAAVTIDVLADKAADAAGNNNTASNQIIRTSDTVAPAFTINDGASANWAQTDMINLTITETNPFTSKYGFSPDNTCNASDTISTNFTSGTGFNITGDRNDYLCAKAVDTAGNETYQLVGQLNMDNTVPALTLNSMFTGQTLTGGNVYPISWTADDLHLGAAPIALEYSINGGTNWNPIGSATANDGTENWTVPSVNTSNGLVRTTATDLANNVSQTDSNTFSVTYSTVTDSTAPVATLNSPNGGEIWENNAAHLITWTATDNLTAAASLLIKLEYSTDGGATWPDVIADTENDGAYSWTPTGLNSTNVLIKVTATDAASLTGSDISNTALAIATPVAYPESICAGSGPYSCSISLSTGWNLISLPIIPTDSAIATVLTGVSGTGTVAMVKYYDSTESDDWKSYVPGISGDLTTIEDGKGYWINMTNSATLTVTGTSAPAAPNPPSTYSVITGWNLIGYKSLTAHKNASTYLSTIPSGFMVFDQNNTNKTSSYLQHGKGYWFWSTGAGSIVAGD